MRYKDLPDWTQLRAAVLEVNDGRTLMAMGQALAERGFLNQHGKVYSSSAVRTILNRANAPPKTIALVRRRKAQERLYRRFT